MRRGSIATALALTVVAAISILALLREGAVARCEAENMRRAASYPQSWRGNHL